MVRRGSNLWHATAELPLAAPSLAANCTADLVIVGGGFTGCAAALEAARMGASVLLLEAQEVGHGGSGRNVGLVNAGLWLTPEKINAEMGATDGQRLTAALAHGPDEVFDIIEREAIACEATRNGTLHLAHTPHGMADLHERQRQGRDVGMPLDLLDRDETTRRTGSQAFHGALLNPEAGTIQPLSYVRGLARAAMRAGAVVHERSPVTRIAREGGDWVISANGHEVRARALLQATNAYPAAGAKPDSARYVPVYYCQFATDPLPGELRKAILPGGEGCWDTALVMTSVRRDKDGRLILGAIGNGEGLGARLHAGWAARKLRHLFPDLPEVTFAHGWSGRIAMTGDHIPKLLSPGPRAYSVFGYSGRGIAPGTIVGVAAAQALLHDKPELLPLPAVETYSENFTVARAAYYEFGAAVTHGLACRGRR